MGCLIFLCLITMAIVCKGSIYRVGDSPGWTIIGNVNYHTWASSKIFHVGDTLIFEYDPRFHNVLQVSRMGYHICNMTAPIATYTTGNDSIVIRKQGHFYFTCGFMGHCQAGQKVDIRVPKMYQTSTGPILSPNVEPNASGVGPRSFYNSGGSTMFCNGILFSCNVGLVVFLIWVVNLAVLLD